MTARKLQKKHPKFIYENFSYSFGKAGLTCKFQFKLEPNIVFRPEILIRDARKSTTKKMSVADMDNLVFHIGLAEIPSYWKCAMSPKIEIRAAKITSEQARWWKNLLMKGLAEFFYVNGVNPHKIGLRIYSADGKKFSVSGVTGKKSPRNFLVLVGGGKDSLVALKLMLAARKKTRLRAAKSRYGEAGVGTMVLGDVKASYDLIRSCGLKRPASIERKIDKRLLGLNKRGYLNGHTPFSSYLAFLGVFCAKLFGYDAVVAANERSANEPSFVSGGTAVNHQYSKSYEFEKSFRGYVKKYLTQNVDYFSVLRPLYELQIAKIATKYPRNLTVTKSCNVGMKKNIWCGKCAKCLSVFVLFYPFVGDAHLKKIFGRNLLEDKNLWRYIPKLIGNEKEKPLECVGTKRENLAALALGLKKAVEKPYILRRFYETNKLPDDSTIKQMMRSWDNKNFLPPEIKSVLRSAIRDL